MDSTANSTSASPAPLTQAEQAELDERLFAVVEGDVDDANAINALIQLGANPNAKNSSAETALMVACEAGHLNIAKVLISHLDVPALNVVDTCGYTALMSAAALSRDELIVAALINAGADVHQRTKLKENALGLATLYKQESEVDFQLFSAMSPCERDFAPYMGRSLLGRLFSPPEEGIAEALVRYQASEAELRERVVNISAGLSAGQNAQNNLGKITEVLALIAEYAFSNCLVNGHARREVMETMGTITPRPSMMFSIGQSLAPLHRRVSNLARNTKNMIDSTIRNNFSHVLSIPPVIPCPVPAIEDKRAEQGASKKVRR
jgi:hypothetical protein